MKTGGVGGPLHFPGYLPYSLPIASVFPSTSLILFSALLSKGFGSPLQMPLNAPRSLAAFPLVLSRMPPGQLRPSKNPKGVANSMRGGSDPPGEGGHIFHRSRGPALKGGLAKIGGRADHPTHLPLPGRLNGRREKLTCTRDERHPHA
jgi:hypothetical protein